MLTPEGYRSRIIDAQINLNMGAFGAVAIEGPKWCGKTWTTLNHASSVFYTGDPAQNFQNKEIATLDPAFVLKGSEPRAIDEWQEVPGIWDAVRFEVDRSHARGRFILTGSSTPPLNATLHSGTGRIERIRMRAMTLLESGDSSGEVSLASLLKGEPPHCTTDISLNELIWLIARGGWPASINLTNEQALLVPKSYYRNLISSDIARLDGIHRDASKMDRVLRALARNNQTAVTNRTLSRDIYDADGPDAVVAESTIALYLNLLERLFIIEYLPAWSPNIRSSARVRKTPVIRYTDPSLALAVLNISVQHIATDLNTFGFMFESLCARDMAVYAESLGHNLYHYKDDTIDSDFIIEMQDGRWGAFEVKLGADRVDEAAKKLLKLKRKLTADGASEPVCLVILCGLTKFGYMRPDGVSVVPITSLGV